MLICIDSCVFIRAFDAPDSDAAQLVQSLTTALPVVIPRLVALEVVRNLHSAELARSFYRLFSAKSGGQIIDQPVPNEPIEAYVALGLRIKGDAYIGAFAEWFNVTHLISDNRHFLRDLRADAYRLLSPGDFLALLREDKTP